MRFLLFRKSFHARIVLTFIIVLIVSLISAYAFTYFLYPEIYQSEQVITSVEDGFDAVLETENALSFEDAQRIASDHEAELVIIDHAGAVQYNTEGSLPLSGTSYDNLSGLTEHESSFIFKSQEELFEIATVRTIQGDSYTLVYQLDASEESQAMRHVIIIALFVVLVVGCISFLIASIPIISPINELSRAAKKMAEGDFSVYIKKKRKDEIGELVDNFNYMSKELQKIERMRQEFVSNVSHEFKSPMTTINGFAKAIRDGVVKEEERDEYLEIIHSSTERLSRLSEHLLQIASLDSEHHPLKKQSYAIDEQLRRVVLSTQLLWEAKDIYVDVDLPSITIEADQDLMEQVWTNLLTNAIKFSHEGSTIEIKAAIDRDTLKISFHDYGIGIPEDHLPHLFERFYTVDVARTPQKSGNGLGLSLVQRILNLHGFSIDVNTSADVGTTFTVEIANQTHRDNFVTVRKSDPGS